MEIVVKGRHIEVSERFREHVHEKLARIEKFEQRQRLSRIEVQIDLERNPRLHDRAARVEMTVRSRGPVIRAEACAEDKMTALDMAIDKLESRLRKAADRRRIHHGSRRPESVAEATAGGDLVESSLVSAVNGNSAVAAEAETVRRAGPIEVVGEGPLVVREKTHDARPMTLDQALYEMEMVGHDFYLFIDKDSAQPSVVYRRHGYDYGVIHLSPSHDMI
ncbi:ribosome hibernation-promoting factor, HPF/YfiA family [Solicola gregarius]|uniref:Ribosome hibernation promoting factor n=1 Tax=Solicola gregarius TaxID=2908642 RepID=A0AA46YKK2_9ACTN|nr:ribosome-associated translation inhibitor RaiA [Solicola gregarius]UYM04048.1 ribosome-associated translation inhibitor RaiA [Solicola gregarius]